MDGPMSSNSVRFDPELTLEQKESANYIADIALQLGNSARKVELSFLAHLLDMAHYEAYRLAYGTDPDLVDIERQRQARETS
jgi:hypothetical protein